MGGKVWSVQEESIFWKLAPKFPPGLQEEAKAAKKGRKDHLKSWQGFVELMEEEWDRENPGQDCPRTYTAISMYEHWFQNFVQKKLSPNAAPFVQQYRALIKKKAENPESDSGDEESESDDLSVSQSSEPSVQESSESEEPGPSGPSEFGVSVPASAIFQQSATPQVLMSEAAIAATIAAFPQNRQEYSRMRDRNHGSPERPNKRLQMMDNNTHDDYNMSAHGGFPDQNGVLVQQNPNFGVQFSEVQPAYGDFRGQSNIGAAYTPFNTGFHGAQNNANLFLEHNVLLDHNVFLDHNVLLDHNNAAPFNCTRVTRPDFVQNNANQLMVHDIAQSTHGTVTGHGGVQKRKRTYE